MRFSRFLKRLKKDNFSWIEEATSAFRQLQESDDIDSVLALLLDFNTDFVVEADASRYGLGLGEVLMQDERPIAYFNQVLGTWPRLSRCTREN